MQKSKPLFSITWENKQQENFVAWFYFWFGSGENPKSKNSLDPNSNFVPKSTFEDLAIYFDFNYLPAFSILASWNSEQFSQDWNRHTNIKILPELMSVLIWPWFYRFPVPSSYWVWRPSFSSAMFPGMSLHTVHGFKGTVLRYCCKDQGYTVELSNLTFNLVFCTPTSVYRYRHKSTFYCKTMS
jgi:hypothetical protein